MKAELLQFMGEHPWLTVFFLLCACQILYAIFLQLPNRIMRHWNIRKHGYPPAHCDADGDFKEDDK